MVNRKINLQSFMIKKQLSIGIVVLSACRPTSCDVREQRQYLPYFQTLVNLKSGLRVNENARCPPKPCECQFLLSIRHGMTEEQRLTVQKISVELVDDKTSKNRKVLGNSTRNAFLAEIRCFQMIQIPPFHPTGCMGSGVSSREPHSVHSSMRGLEGRAGVNKRSTCIMVCEMAHERKNSRLHESFLRMNVFIVGIGLQTIRGIDEVG